MKHEGNSNTTWKLSTWNDLQIFERGLEDLKIGEHLNYSNVEIGQNT